MEVTKYPRLVQEAHNQERTYIAVSDRQQVNFDAKPEQGPKIECC